MDQQFSLSWNNFHGNLSKGFAGLLGNGEFVDVTLAVEGHLLQAHKVILSICSPYFKRMFQLNPCQHPIVVLRDVTHKAMKDLLQFMYHGEVSVKREDLTSFIGTAEVLQIKGLTNKETEENECETGHETPKPSLQNLTSTETVCNLDTCDVTNNDDITQNESELIKQRQVIEKLNRLSNFKRKSEELLQKTYYSDIINSEKRSKLKDKSNYKVNSQVSNYESIRNIYDEIPINITTAYNLEVHKASNEFRDTNDNKEQSSSEPLELKTECDDSDIIVTDPAVCTSPKSYDGPRDGSKESSVPLDYHSPQDNNTSLNSFFMDLKNFVNGKTCNPLRQNNEDIQRNPHAHKLVTIPQKEDGKKKYPQRSCRLCWKIGRRRDTRFMCSACEMPFCKSSCFGIHINDILKVSQLQAEYYAS